MSRKPANRASKSYESWQERVEALVKKGIYPRSVEQTVAVYEYTVKPHFRRNKRHFHGDLDLYDAAHRFIKSLVGEARKKGSQ